MANLKKLSVFFLSLILPALCLAQTGTSAELFQQGTQSYLAKDYAKAHESFSRALDQDPNNAVVLTNLALTEFQLGKKPLAVGLLRKALASDPELSTAEAGLKFVLSQLGVKEVPRQIQTYESVRAKLIQPVPLSAYLILSALTFFAAGWTLISYGGRRKKAMQEEAAAPSFPLVSTFLTLSFVIFTGLLALKVYDSTILRGTIITEKVSLQTAPGDNQVAILELFGGMEVVARQTQGDWVQVTYPGSLTGWIKKDAVLMTR
ncbi:MAG: TPR domain-containing protein [Bdellovibrio sp. ArHS]|uniref:tetratricopeptide repeat protein n=1 Tax=Bdellovibrio sp. ArHS TaxID=1569284 RepID=UPI00058307D9|nr:tetratricopeptide repeat protein [Bdellovibrio sp. ArHS]KHD88529.1 MAG: TPR domain-containing protein [Bdellovibrio sp. ArHS]